MKSNEKALSRNYNAQELELFCHNRFYGPLVVAYNANKAPYYLVDFTVRDLENIEQINLNFQNKSNLFACLYLNLKVSKMTMCQTAWAIFPFCK